MQNFRTVPNQRRMKWKSFRIAIPEWLFSRGARKISLKPEAAWGGDAIATRASTGISGLPVVVSWRLGEGEILWWAGPGPLTNSGITRDDNLNLFPERSEQSSREAKAGSRTFIGTNTFTERPGVAVGIFPENSRAVGDAAAYDSWFGGAFLPSAVAAALQPFRSWFRVCRRSNLLIQLGGLYEARAR